MIAVLTASRCIFVGVCMPHGKTRINKSAKIRSKLQNQCKKPISLEFQRDMALAFETLISIGWNSNLLRYYDIFIDVINTICVCHEYFPEQKTEIKLLGSRWGRKSAFPAYVCYVISSFGVFETYWNILTIFNLKYATVFKRSWHYMPPASIQTAWRADWAFLSPPAWLGIVFMESLGTQQTADSLTLLQHRFKVTDYTDSETLLAHQKWHWWPIWWHWWWSHKHVDFLHVDGLVHPFARFEQNNVVVGCFLHVPFLNNFMWFQDSKLLCCVWWFFRIMSNPFSLESLPTTDQENHTANPKQLLRMKIAASFLKEVWVLVFRDQDQEGTG